MAKGNRRKRRRRVEAERSLAGEFLQRSARWLPPLRTKRARVGHPHQFALTSAHGNLVLRGEQLQIFGFPAHGGVDTIASARMIEENPFLNRAGIHLAIRSEERRVGKEC